MGRYIVEYELPYTYRVQIGVEASGAEEASAVVSEMMDLGTLWDNKPDSPLLFDDFEEQDDGSVLEFRVVQALGVGESWPRVDSSVLHWISREEAFRSAKALVALIDERREAGATGMIDPQCPRFVEACALAMAASAAIRSTVG